MIILGIVLLLLWWFLAPVVPLPPPIWELVHAFGWIFIIVGAILWLLSFLGHPVGRGVGTGPRGGRYWW